jgi:hypothetical protein
LDEYCRMVLAWRSLLHAVVAMSMDGFPGAVLTPEDQRGSDLQLSQLRGPSNCPNQRSMKAPYAISPLAVRKAVSLVTSARPGTNCDATQSQRSLTSAQPLSTPPQNPHWLTSSVWDKLLLSSCSVLERLPLCVHRSESTSANCYERVLLELFVAYSPWNDIRLFRRTPSTRSSSCPSGLTNQAS